MKINSRFKYICGIMITLVLWQLIAVRTNNIILPSPLDIILYVLKKKEIFLVHGLYSLGRVTLGLIITFGIGLVIGIVSGVSPRINESLTPLVYFAYPIPKMALLPFVLLIFGIGEASKIAMIVLISIFPVILSIRDGITNIDKENFNIMSSLGAGKKDIIFEIVIPGIMPCMLTTLRLTVGTALSILFLTENFGTRYGLGYHIMESWMRADYKGMYGAVIIISIIGMILYMLLDILESKICRWKKSI